MIKKEKIKNKINYQKGDVSIVVAVLLVSVLLVIGLGLSLLMLQQIKISTQVGHSVIALYAAEAGAERCLYDIRKTGAVSCSYTNVALEETGLLSSAKYTTNYNGTNEINSIGQFMDTTRKLNLSW